MTKTITCSMSDLALKAGAAAVLAMGLAISYTPAQADIVMPGIYKFMDHPDAALTSIEPPAVNYGLRLDDSAPGGTAAERTFSVEDHGSMVTLDWTGDLTTATISGKVARNSDLGPGFDLWDVSFTVTGITALSGTLGDGTDGWFADAANVNGTLTGTGANLGTTYKLDGKNNRAGHGMIFDNDGHRCSGHADPCAPDAITLIGWLIVDDIMPTKTNDWLVLAIKLPDRVSEPGTLAVLGLGVLGLGYLRRRRQR